MRNRNWVRFLAYVTGSVQVPTPWLLAEGLPVSQDARADFEINATSQRPITLRSAGLDKVSVSRQKVATDVSEPANVVNSISNICFGRVVASGAPEANR
jgi:hypothetical protein